MSSTSEKYFLFLAASSGVRGGGGIVFGVSSPESSPPARGENEFLVAENGERSRSEWEDNSVTIQNQNNELVNWEIEEVDPIVIHQQHTIQEIEKDTSTWVKQNLIKLGKIFEVDFQGHEEEAIELFLQIHSYRLARRMEQELASSQINFIVWGGVLANQAFLYLEDESCRNEDVKMDLWITRKDMVKNENIWAKVEVTSVANKM
ncbi:hypothetical protein H5410_014076 [Solanum commersonii]|uniref:Uncharacterized protein n=1 Tax=Solanum commersonii TaxID=4109 RepID=A0A9J5ZQB3_SOLCO|nr:hypothetical protein H5410_014076 [Solanum commersonii]